MERNARAGTPYELTPDNSRLSKAREIETSSGGTEDIRFNSAAVSVTLDSGDCDNGPS